jgi:hypothetical protein
MYSHPSSGMLSLDPYIVDVLLPDLVGHDRRPSAFLVYLALWRKAHDAGGEIEVTLRLLTEATGLSKRAVQDALGHLAKRRLITAHRPTTSSVARFRVHEPWAERRRAKSAGKSPGA